MGNLTDIHHFYHSSKASPLYLKDMTKVVKGDQQGDHAVLPTALKQYLRSSDFLS